MKNSNDRRYRRQRGSSHLLLVLVIVTLFAMLASGMIRVATLASTLEARERYTFNAKENAKSVALLASKTLERDLGLYLQQSLQSAVGNGINTRVPVFLGADFETIHWDYDLSFPGYGPGERGEVDVIIRLAGAPEERTLSGVRAERRGVMIDEYRFVVEIRAKGYSAMDTVAHAEAFASQYVWVLSGPAASPLISRVREAGSRTGAFAGSANKGEGALSGIGGEAIPAGTILISNLSGGFVVPSVPTEPDGVWTGDPEVVSGPTRFGMDKGDAVYVYEIRGLPVGTVGHLPNTTVLCYDTWRFGMGTYNRGTDAADFYEGPNNALAHRKGTPWYAVVAVRAPSAGEALEMPLGTGRLNLPDGRVFQLPPIPDGWQSEMRRISVGGDEHLVTAQPLPPTETNTARGDGFVIQGSTLGNGPTATGPMLEDTRTTIFVGGYGQDLGGSGQFVNFGRQYTGSGPVQIPLLTVMARRNELRISYAGATSSPVYNSKHYSLEPEDPIGPGDPPPPGGGCSTCPPPTPVIALLGLLYSPGDIVLVPANVADAAASK